MIKIQKLKKVRIVSIFMILGFTLIFTSKLNHFKSLGEQGLNFEPIIPFSGSATFIDQDITTNTTWGIVGSPYYIDDNILINQGVKLTIDPGVEVLFNGSYTITVEGVLNATGTRNNPIIFTSNASIPAKSDWGSIYFKNPSSDIESTIKYSEISYSDNGIRLENAFPEISDCTFFNNTNGVYLYIMNEDVDRNIPSIENSTFYHNDYGINVNRLDWGAILPELDIRLMNNNIFENENGMYFEFVDDLGSITFLNNEIFNNTNNGLYFNRIEDITNNMTFIKNNISFNSNYGLFFNIHNFGFITNLLFIDNTIYNNSNHGLAFNGDASDITSLTFEKNQIYNNQNDGIYIADWFEPNRIYNNNIFNNRNYNIECLWNAASQKIDATYNWWGTNNTSEIEQKLFDYSDNSNYAEIIYNPFLNYTPILNAPILNLIESPSITGNVSLSWNQVTLADSYMIYRSDSLIIDISGMEPIVSGLEDTTYVDENLLDGTYYYVVIATDYSVNTSISNCQSVVVNKDTIVPSIIIISPYPDQLFGQISPSFNVEISDPNLDTMWYTIDGGLTNITFTTNGTIDQNNWTAPIDGPITVFFYANDTLGHINSSQVLIYKDTINPIINITNPSDSQLLGESAPDFNVEISDPNLDTMWYTIDGGLTNITFTTNDTIDQNNWTARGDGPVMITFYANDTLGHINSAQVLINKDTTNSIINIISPVPDQFAGANSPEFTVEISDPNLDTMWYTLDDGMTNITFSVNGTIDQSNWTALIDGSVTLIFYANDTLAHISSAQVIIIKDTTIPIINIISPVPDQFAGANSPEFIVEISDPNLDSMWYTIDGGLTNISFITNETIDQNNWVAHIDGPVSIIFYANDTAGKTAFSEIIVRKDTETPIISIIEPSINDIFELAPAYEVTITESNLDIIWYTLDGGENNFTVSELTGIINQDQWENLPNGYVTIRFYANDTLGNVNSTEITVIKNSEAPIISIIEPSLNDIFELAPVYEVTITESNLDTIWYTLDGGENNFTVSELTGIINQDQWENLPNGYVTIRFYANDTLGHLNFDEVIIVKDVSTPTSPPGVPGYDLFLLLGIISLVSVIIMKFKFHKKIK